MNGWLDPANYGPNSRQWLGHYFRYHLARGFVQADDTVIDVASGVGYGSRVLAEVAQRVWAIDGDAQALTRLKDKYNRPNIIPRQMNLDQSISLPSANVIVSFETIEHLERPEQFAADIRRCAQRLIVLSAPVIPTVGVNPYHKHDFTESSLQQLILQDGWILYEFIRQGPYGLIVAYK